jgi:hypothetical protein
MIRWHSVHGKYMDFKLRLFESKVFFFSMFYVLV